MAGRFFNGKTQEQRWNQFTRCCLMADARVSRKAGATQPNVTNDKKKKLNHIRNVDSARYTNGVERGSTGPTHLTLVLTFDALGETDRWSTFFLLATEKK